jgi:hypothetical protein
MQRDFDVLLAHSGQLDHGDHVVVALIEIERGRPTSKKLSRTRGARPERQLEKRVKFIRQIAPPISW